jgi:hypothetical protein
MPALPPLGKAGAGKLDGGDPRQSEYQRCATYARNAPLSACGLSAISVTRPSQLDDLPAGACAVTPPRRHKRAALLEQVTAKIGALSRIAETMC